MLSRRRPTLPGNTLPSAPRWVEPTAIARALRALAVSSRPDATDCGRTPGRSSDASPATVRTPSDVTTTNIGGPVQGSSTRASATASLAASEPSKPTTIPGPCTDSSLGIAWTSPPPGCIASGYSGRTAPRLEALRRGRRGGLSAELRRAGLGPIAVVLRVRGAVPQFTLSGPGDRPDGGRLVVRQGAWLMATSITLIESSVAPDDGRRLAAFGHRERVAAGVSA